MRNISKALRPFALQFQHLRRQRRGERLEEYAGLASSLTDEEAKMSAVNLFSDYLETPLAAARWGVFQKVAALAWSLTDADLREEALVSLRSEVIVLPESEQAPARALLKQPPQGT